MQVADNVFIVTGAGNGIGRCLALELVGRGGIVAGADLDEGGLAETRALVGPEAAGRFTPYVLDIGDHDAVDAFPGQVASTYGRLDGLFNVAGIGQRPQTTREVSDEAIERLMRVNFLGAAWLSRAALPHLEQRPRAVIMLTASLAAIAPTPGAAIYGASKAALEAFGHGMAQDVRHGPGHVTVTTVLPGTVWTGLVRDTSAELGVSERLTKAFAARPERIAHQMIEATLKGRVRAVVGKDAHFYNGLRRLSFRVVERASDLQVGTIFYKKR